MHCFRMCYIASNKCCVPLISFCLWLFHSLRFTFPAEPLLFWPTRKSITATETQSAIHCEMETQHTSVTQPTSIHSVFAIISLESPHFPVNRLQIQLSARCYEYLLSCFFLSLLIIKY